VQALQAKFTGPTRLCAVVKANAYGLNAELIVSAIGDLCQAFAVVTIPEAEAISPLIPGKLLLAMRPAFGGMDPELLKLAAHRQITITISSLEGARYVQSVLAKLNLSLDCHLKIDTGMGRGGSAIDQAGAILAFLHENSRFLRVTGVFSHFAQADASDTTFTNEQIATFRQFTSDHHLLDDPAVICHLANSLGTLRCPQAHFDMVRPGIVLYGYTCQGHHRQFPLKPAVRVEAPLIQVKKIPAGQTCGYARSFTAPCPMTIGLVPMGYADGVRRVLSNKGVMKIGQQVVPILGRISMDQTIIDLTQIPNPHEGMTVTVIDDQFDSPCNVQALATASQTVCHEILTGLGSRVKRVLVPVMDSHPPIANYPCSCKNRRQLA
jgi:alanine racemase